MQQKLVPDPLLILVNNSKQPSHLRSSFKTTLSFYKSLVEWLVKSLTMLKCGSRTSLHALQDKGQKGSDLILRMDSLDTLFLCSMGQQTWLCS